ncbi:MAG TPA: alpha/beta hydrolase [Anaerolineales bacterium]
MRTQIHKFSMAYDEEGKGLPVLWIHGFPLNRQMWQLQESGLKSAARILAPDLRGFGDSQPTGGTYSMDLLADDCVAFLDALNINRPVVVAGLSMGGYITMAFYRKFASRMAGMILAATRPGPDSPEGKTGRDQAAAMVQRGGVLEVVESMLPKLLAPATYQEHPELVAQLKELMKHNTVDGIVGALMGMKERPDSTPILNKIDLPVLILHGENDQIIPPKEAEVMHSAIRGSKLEILPRAGHMLNMEQPGLFNQAVSRFLAAL